MTRGCDPRGRTFFLFVSMLLTMSLACKSSRHITIAVIPETTAQELSESEHAGAERAARGFDWNIYWNGPAREDDFPQQIHLVQQAIDRKVAGLILSPDHAVALISPVRSALAHGIPSVIVGSPLGTSPSDDLVFVLNDDKATGRLAADRAGLYLKPDDTVAVLGIDPNILGSINRANAFETSLHQKFPKVRIIEKRSISFSIAEAEESVQKTIRSEPGLRVIVALDINQARAAMRALHNSKSKEKIVLIGCDQDLDLMLHLRLGDIDSVIAEDSRTMGSLAVQIIHKRLHGESTDSETVVEPILVTRENIDTAAVQEILNMDWKG